MAVLSGEQTSSGLSARDVAALLVFDVFIVSNKKNMTPVSSSRTLPSAVFSGTASRTLVDLSRGRIPARCGGPPLSSRLVAPLLLSFARGVEVLEADSCCKSSHSWRAPGSPRPICRTSNVTNHPGVGNTSLSSSLCLLFSLSPHPLFFRCLSRCHSPTSRLLSLLSLQLFFAGIVSDTFC